MNKTTLIKPEQQGPPTALKMKLGVYVHTSICEPLQQFLYQSPYFVYINRQHVANNVLSTALKKTNSLNNMTMIVYLPKEALLRNNFELF